MKILIIGLLVSGACFGQTYCDNDQWDSSTRFDGPVGVAGDYGVVEYLGHNPTPSENVGSYKFKSDIEFTMDFVGEPRHSCKKVSPFNWACKMGRWFRYDLVCEF